MRKLHLPEFLMLAALTAAGCQRADEKTEPKQESLSPTPSAAPNSQAATATEAPDAPLAVQVAGLATCQANSGMQNWIDEVVRVSDADGDGKISRTEAQATVNFLVGGFLFAADANHDGIVTPEEGRKARQQLIDQHPALATLLEQARDATGGSPFKELAQMLDVNYKQSITLTQARDAAARVLADVYRVADRNHDGAIGVVEARQAALSGAGLLGDRLFKAADSNADHVLDLAEFQKPVDATIQLAFHLADKNGDGKLTESEARLAMDAMARRLGVPLPSPNPAAQATP